MAELLDGRGQGLGQEQDLFDHQHRRPRHRHGRLHHDPALHPLRAELRRMDPECGGQLPVPGLVPEPRRRRARLLPNVFLRHQGPHQEGLPAGRARGLFPERRPGPVQGRRGDRDRGLFLHRRRFPESRQLAAGRRHDADRPQHRRHDPVGGEEALRHRPGPRPGVHFDFARHQDGLQDCRHLEGPAEELAPQGRRHRPGRLPDLQRPEPGLPDLLGLPVGLCLRQASPRLGRRRHAGADAGVGEAQHPRRAQRRHQLQCRRRPGLAFHQHPRRPPRQGAGGVDHPGQRPQEHRHFRHHRRPHPRHGGGQLHQPRHRPRQPARPRSRLAQGARRQPQAIDRPVRRRIDPDFRRVDAACPGAGRAAGEAVRGLPRGGPVPSLFRRRRDPAPGHRPGAAGRHSRRPLPRLLPLPLPAGAGAESQSLGGGNAGLGPAADGARRAAVRRVHRPHHLHRRHLRADGLRPVGRPRLQARPYRPGGRAGPRPAVGQRRDHRRRLRAGAGRGRRRPHRHRHHHRQQQQHRSAAAGRQQDGQHRPVQRRRRLLRRHGPDHEGWPLVRPEPGDGRHDDALSAGQGDRAGARQARRQRRPQRICGAEARLQIAAGRARQDRAQRTLLRGGRGRRHPRHRRRRRQPLPHRSPADRPDHVPQRQSGAELGHRPLQWRSGGGPRRPRARVEEDHQRGALHCRIQRRHHRQGL